VVQAAPGPVLPVQFLPETGTQEALQADKVAMGIALVVAPVWIAFIVFWAWRRSNKKDLAP
jgi:hypothetical protein